MSTHAQNNKRIAKNTLMLYFRMLLMMGVTLYTSRVVLAALGVEDYGIYNVVGGVVAMFTMVSESLSKAISRFITFELGRGDQQRLNTIFSTSVIIQLLISVVVVLLVESVGVWFLETKMVIPMDRLPAARWVLQFSLITLVINLISIPYNAAIIAHERMSAFAYISILEALGRLGIAYFIVISPIDKLVFYALMMTMVALMVRLAYGLYCGRHFEECQGVRLSFDRGVFREMFAFAGWNMIGASSTILRDQGGNILLNMFGGPVVNAAMGIANQIRVAVIQFSANFTVALSPQITKSYASGDREYMMSLIFRGSRLSFYMLLLLSLPILMSTEYILSLWLVDVPPHTVSFVRLSILFGMIESISRPLYTAMLATGNIKRYQIVVGGMNMLNMPVSYLMLRLHFPSQIVLCVAILVSISCLIIRVVMLRDMIRLPVGGFIKRVVANLFLVSIASATLPCVLMFCVDEWASISLVACVVAVLSTLSAIYLVGCNREERSFINSKIGGMISKLCNGRSNG